MHSDVITDDASSDIGDGQSSQTQDEENEEWHFISGGLEKSKLWVT